MNPDVIQERGNGSQPVPTTHDPGREFDAVVPNLTNSVRRFSDLSQKQYRTASLNRIPQNGIRIGIRLAGGRLRLIDLLEVVSVTAQGNYILLQETCRSHILRNSIEHMENALRDYGFIRIHRSVLVNAALALDVQSKPPGKYSLRTTDGKQYVVSRTYMRNLQEFASIWIGNINFISSRYEQQGLTDVLE